ncbi:glycosyltransferase [Legionella quateirensis]|nr:glycosyltransferase [Legionella quateirensis]
MMVLDSYPPDLNGGAYFTHRLAQSLQDRGHEVLVICPSRTFRQNYGEYHGVRLYRVRSWPILLYKNFRVCWPVFIKKGIQKAIADYNPEVMHIQGKFFLGSICHRICLSMGIPMLATNHFMPENFFHYTYLPKRFESWFHSMCWKNIVAMLSTVDVVTTPTKTAVKLLEQTQLKKEIYPVSCGIDLQKFKPAQDADFLRQQFNIPVKPTLLYTGRLDKEKNLFVVIHAFYQAVQQLDCHLVLTGNGTEKKRLEYLAKELNISQHITFTGYLADDDYPKIYGLADCFVHAGTAELQSIVALEAIASGLPLLGANAMALPELIKHGVNGYLFRPDDTNTLSRYMIELLENTDKCREMGMESRTLSLTHDIGNTAIQYEQLYQRICKK